MYIAKFPKTDKIMGELTKLTLAAELKKEKKVMYTAKFPKPYEIKLILSFYLFYLDTYNFVILLILFRYTQFKYYFLILNTISNYKIISI